MVRAEQKIGHGDQQVPLNQEHHVGTQLQRPAAIQQDHNTGLNLDRQASIDRWAEAARSATTDPEPIRGRRRDTRQAPTRIKPFSNRAPGCYSPKNGRKEFEIKLISPEQLFHSLLKAYSKPGRIPDRCILPVPSYSETSPRSPS